MFNVKKKDGFGTEIVLLNQNLKIIFHAREKKNSIFIKTLLGYWHLSKKSLLALLSKQK